MLAHRITPTILVRNGHLVKGTSFSADRIVGNALQAARIHAMRGVDEILILDVSATREKREPDYDMIRRLTETARVPVTVGGGIMALTDVQKLLDAGADKICVSATKQLLIRDVASVYGAQCVVASVDVSVDLDYQSAALEQAERVVELGAGEILLQSIDNDGTMQGYDLDLINAVAPYLPVPVIASGGCHGYQDMEKALQAGADAVAAGALFQFTDATPKGAAEYLNERGVEVRL